MKYNELSVLPNRDKKRVGRGISAGQGKTAGRGTKGQKARTGKKLRVTFQGGQRPLVSGVPKRRGFKSLRVPAQIVFLDNLNIFNDKLVDNMAMYEAGLISTPFQSVKIILRGELNSKINVETQGASKSVVELIEKNGGSFKKTVTPIKKKSPEDN
jgi:large subunit ribosomal protein L15